MRTLCIVIALLGTLVSFSQSEKRQIRKFADVNPDDFVPKAYTLDSNANAVVLFDIGKAEYGTDTRGSFAIIYKYHQRIRLMNKNGFEAATVQIPILKISGAEEFLEKMEANTYTIENGKVVATKVDKSSIFKDKVSKDYLVQKFTFPNLQEGCIIEYTYTISSPFIQDLHEWYFQTEYPVLWSEYDVRIPTFYDFVMLKQGYHPYVIDKTEMSRDNYSVYMAGETASDRGELMNFSSDTYHITWAMQDVPAIKEESFTTTIGNHLSKIEFQLSAIRYPNQPVKNVMRTWDQVAEELMKSENFGQSIKENNGWLNDELKKITASSSTDLEKAQKIFAYVRDNFICTEHSGKYISTTLRKVFDSKKGNVAELNMLLAAMLIKAGFQTDPLLLSTRSHGKTFDLYPIMERMNYVIARTKIDDQYYVLDASNSKIGFGHLPLECYNGNARIIAETPNLVDLSADSLLESKITSIFIINDEKGNGQSGSFNSKLGYYESYALRRKIVTSTREEISKDFKKSYPFDAKLENIDLELLNTYEEPITVKYDFKFTPDDDILYINPLFGEATKENPFKSVKRDYPVEMPFTFNETYILDMEIPKGYMVDELPRSTKVNYNENEGLFEYIITNDGQHIRLRSKVCLYRATFASEDYESLRELFAYIVKKQSEQIVLKKK